jgi:Tfp pilus assembly protein PilV
MTARLQASAGAAASRRRFAAEEGFGIIEVLVSGLVVVLLSFAVFAAIDAAGRTADSNKSRSVAASVAQDDQERLRSMTISDLANRDETRTVTVDGESYTVRSKGEYVIGPPDATTGCTSSEQNPRYLKITSIVSWPGLQGTSPVQQDSLRAIPNGSLNGRGSLAVSIQDRNAAGVPDVSVSISGPQSVTGTTNSNGCVIFGYIRSGAYTVSFSQPGYVEAKYPNRTDISDPVVVAEDSLASKSYQYDRAGEASVAYETTTNVGSSTTSSTTGDGFTVSNSLMGSVSARTFAHASAATATSGKVLFPFTSDYEIWAGKCAENQPPSGFSQTVRIPAGGSSSPVNVREPRLRVQPKDAQGADVTTGKVVFYPQTSGCTANAVATQVGPNSPDNRLYDAPMPFGTYAACIQNPANNPTSWATWTGLVNDNPTGKLYPADPSAGRPYLSSLTPCTT